MQGFWKIINGMVLPEDTFIYFNFIEVEGKLDIGGFVLVILLQGTGCHRFLNVFLKFETSLCILQFR